MEKYMTFGEGQLQFINSLQFMSESLENLSSKLSPQDLVIIRKGLTDAEVELLQRKGVYPYEYIDSFERFNEKHIPPKEKFYSKLPRSGIKGDEYDYVHKVLETFGCNNFGDYHDIYLKTDVKLITEKLLV